MKLRAFLLFASLLALAVPARAQEQAGSFFFKDGDTVVMIGDSITEQRLYSKYVELWTVTRFPNWNLTFRNVGIGGDRSPGGNGRFQRDVLAFKPTAVTVDFGMNDGGYGGFNPGAYDNYMKGLQGMADQAKAANLRMAWITPQPIERPEPGNQLAAYNVTLEKFSAGVKEIADKNNGVFVDQFHPYLAVMNKARAQDPKIRVTGGDAVHPGPTGQALMAASILKGLNFPPQVADVVIDGETVKTKNCKVTDLDAKGGGVRFQRLDMALPYFPTEARAILKYAPILEETNQYGLQVRGLKEGKYEVKLGGKKAAEVTADELARGVNLASAALTVGPITDQIKAVTQAVEAKTNYFHDQIFRGITLNGGLKDAGVRTKLMDERMQKMPELDAAIRTALTMRPYQVEIVPLAKE